MPAQQHGRGHRGAPRQAQAAHEAERRRGLHHPVGRRAWERVHGQRGPPSGVDHGLHGQRRRRGGHHDGGSALDRLALLGASQQAARLQQLDPDEEGRAGRTKHREVAGEEPG